MPSAKPIRLLNWKPLAAASLLVLILSISSAIPVVVLRQARPQGLYRADTSSRAAIRTTARIGNRWEAVAATLPGAFANGAGVVKELFPTARVTSAYRGPEHPLSKKNPSSYHAKTAGAVDIAPIPGMTFGQYVAKIRGAGYKIIEARDEVSNPSSHATGPHWHVVIGK